MVDENGIFFTISYHRKGINLMTFLLALSTKKKDLKNKLVLAVKGTAQ